MSPQASSTSSPSWDSSGSPRSVSTTGACPSADRPDIETDAYINVDDVDALYEEHLAREVTIFRGLYGGSDPPRFGTGRNVWKASVRIWTCRLRDWNAPALPVQRGAFSLRHSRRRSPPGVSPFPRTACVRAEFSRVARDLGPGTPVNAAWVARRVRINSRAQRTVDLVGETTRRGVKEEPWK